MLGVFFDILSGVLKHREPVEWRPRMSDWGELASAMYEHVGWERDMFKLDYDLVEGGQHDLALESLVGDHVLQYLYAEFDDGKDVLIKSPHDMWEEVKMRVPLDSRRWFPTSSQHFGKELNRLKQALAYKGFAVDRGTVGRDNAKRKVIKVTRIDDVGSTGVDAGSTIPDLVDPALNRIDTPESDRPGRVGSMGSTDSVSSLNNKKKKGRRSSKSRKQIVDPVDPAPQKPGESGLDKPKNPGSTNSESVGPASTPNGGSSTPNGLITTDEGVQEALRKLKGNK